MLPWRRQVGADKENPPAAAANLTQRASLLQVSFVKGKSSFACVEQNAQPGTHDERSIAYSDG